MECIFCKILDNAIPSYKIYEDDMVMAFLDINPITPGHTLVIPKVHTLDISTISDDLLLHIVGVSKEIANTLVTKLGANGFSLAQNNGCAQDVKHFHMHVIPRYEKEFKLDIEDVYKKITHQE